MTNECEPAKKKLPALSRLKQGFDSPRERHATIFCEVLRHSTMPPLRQAENERSHGTVSIIRLIAGASSVLGMSVELRAADACPVSSCRQWDGLGLAETLWREALRYLVPIVCVPKRAHGGR
jgi:hypothetical protein